MDFGKGRLIVGSLLCSVGASILAVVGCAASPTGGAREGLDLRDPDAAFMKRVERDPFPRAEQAQMKR